MAVNVLIYGVRGYTFHVTMFHIFSVLVKLNVATLLDYNLTYKYLTLFIRKRRESFFPNFCTCANLPRRRGKLVYGKSTRQNQDARFLILKKIDKD